MYILIVKIQQFKPEGRLSSKYVITLNGDEIAVFEDYQAYWGFNNCGDNFVGHRAQKALSESPVVFRIEDLNVTAKLSYVGTQVTEVSEFTLVLDETPFKDLEEYKDVGTVPDIGHSTIEEH